MCTHSLHSDLQFATSACAAQPIPSRVAVNNAVRRWFDSQNLTGSLESFAPLKNLTYLEASNNRLSGRIPPSLCGIECLAGGKSNNFSCPLPKPGCCAIASCGNAPPPPFPKSSMGECYPQ